MSSLLLTLAIHLSVENKMIVGKSYKNREVWTRMALR